MEKKTSGNPILYLFLSVLYLNIFTGEMAAAQIIPIRVGVVIDMNDYGEMTLTCISMALSEFYATHDHYRTRLVLTNRDSKEDVVGAAAAALDLLKNVQVQAIIGPVYSVQANFLIALGHKAQVPIITFSATSPALTSIRSPYFIRAALNDSSQVEAIGAIVKAFGWQEVVLIYEDNEFGEGIVPFLTDALENVNCRVPYRSVISPLATDDQITVELLNLMTMHTRVFVVHMMGRLASRLFTAAKQRGMMSKEYAWIITDGITIELNSMDHFVIQSMLGVIGVKPYVPKTNNLDDFAIRYKKRVLKNNPRAYPPDLDIFRLWAYDSAVALAMAAEKASLRNPTYRDANITRNSTDLEAFGISDAGPRLIQALSTTKFKGLAGDFELVDGQLQAPLFEIVNMVGPGDRVIGYWTKQNGIVKELNFPSPNTPESKLGPIIWPGEASSPPKGWVIPTNGKKLRVGVPVKVGFTEFVRVTWNSDNSTKVEGYCIDVFEAVMAALPYGVHYEYIPFAKPDRDMAGNYNDLAYQVYLGNFDAVAGDVTIVANRSQYVDFTLPFTESGVSMVVPMQDDQTKDGWVFLKPLTLEVWLISFCALVFIGGLLWIFEHGRNRHFGGPFWFFAFSSIVLADKENMKSNLSKFLVIVWLVVVVILTHVYTASLASMLTVQKLQPTVTDVNVLIKNREYVGYMKGSFVFGLLKNIGFDEARLVQYHSPEQLDELLYKGSRKGGIAAAFHEIPYIKLFLSKYCSKYTMVESIHNADGFGFVFPIGSPLVSDVSRAILNVTESKKMAEIERKWLGNDDKCPDPNTLLSPKSIGIASFWPLFVGVAVAGGIVFAIYVILFLIDNRDIFEDDDGSMRNLLERFLNNDRGIVNNAVNGPANPDADNGPDNLDRVVNHADNGPANPDPNQ